MSINLTDRRPPKSLPGPQPAPDPLDYVKLAHWVANAFLRHHPQYLNQSEDVHAEAALGLLVCVQKFDRNRGAKFSTYASTGIYRYLQRWADMYAHHVDKGNRNRLVSLHAATSDGYCLALEIAENRDDMSRHWRDKEEVERLLAKLEPRDRECLKLRFLQGLSRGDVGKLMGRVCKERVRQIEVRAIGRARG